MKSFLSSFKNIQVFSLLIGLAVGAFIALLITYFYVNEGHARMRGYSMSKQYIKDTCMRKYGIGKEETINHEAMGHTMSNPYMMGNVMSEEQFLKEMILHHEAADLMAKQVLSLNPSEKVKQLADVIVSAQAREIADMKSWLDQ